MLRSSLKIFLLLVLLSLGAVLGFAALRLRGPEEALREAAASCERGEYARAIALLDLNERSYSLQRDPSKLQRLLRLRYEANQQLENHPAALRDLERLLQAVDQVDETLRLDHIRLLAAVGRGEEALRVAVEFLRAQPGHGRAHELAGEALQSMYRDELGLVVTGMERELGLLLYTQARSSLLAYLYRPDGDHEVEQGRAALQDLYLVRPSLAPGWPTLLRRLQDLRRRIQDSLIHYQAALEAPGEPVAAMRALALSLDQSARIEDLLLLCESYRLRFDHVYVHEAGSFAVWALLRANAPAAAHATALRWLPSNELKAMTDASRCGPGTNDLLLARYAAALQLGERVLLERLASDVRHLESLGWKTGAVNSLVHGTLNSLRGEHEKADRSLRWGIYHLLQRSLPLGQLDLVPLLVPLRLQAMAAQGIAENDQLQVFAEWRKGRPQDLRPQVALAEHQRARGRAAAGLLVLEEACQQRPDDPELFALRLAFAREAWLGSDQSGEQLLAKVLQHGENALDVPQPLSYLLCAEVALQQGIAPVALAAARRAGDKFPNQLLPRLLEARAELLAKQYTSATRLAEAILASYPDHSEAADLLLAAQQRSAGLDDGKLAVLLPQATITPALSAAVLRAALRDQPKAALAFVPHALPASSSLELRLLAAEAQARAGQVAAARELLTAVASELSTASEADRGAYVAAAAALWQTLAPQTADADLTNQVMGRLCALDPLPAAAASHLIQLARHLLDSHPNTAYLLANNGVACATSGDRNGETHWLLARAALRSGRVRRATEHATAAIAFPEGRPAAETLTLLYLLDGRPERAALTYKLVDRPGNAALAARLQDPVRALQLTEEALQRDPADLLAMLTLQCLDPAPPDPALEFGGVQERMELLLLLAALAEPGLGRSVLAQISKLAKTQPRAVAARLLLARAYLDVGNPEAAIPVYEQLLAEKQDWQPLWRELALAVDSGRLELPDRWLEALGRGVGRDVAKASPLARAVATLRTADFLAKSGNLNVADQLRLDAWGLPGAPPPGPTELASIAARGRVADALRLLSRLRSASDGELRRELDRLQASLVAELLVSGKDALTALREAHALLTSVGPHGQVLHLLLAAAARGEIPAFPPAQLRELLRGHIALVATGRDDSEWLWPSVLALLQIDGLGKTAELVDQQLATHPSQLAFWRCRAELRCHRGEAAAAVAEFRRVLQHANDADATLALLVLAGAWHQIAADDETLFQQLPAQLRESARGQLARGLWLLRQGKPDEATGPLSKAAAEPDGLHLQALALANLQARPKDGRGRERAQQALQRLLQTYPNSARARYAGSLLRQLSGN